MKRKFLLLITAIMLTTAIFTGCGNSINTNNSSDSEKSSSTAKASAAKTSYPVTFDAFDSEGKTYKQTFNNAPKKVITNNQSSTELLLTLGLKDSLIGTGDLDTPIPEALKADYESVAAIAKKGDAAKEVVVGSGADLVIGRAASFKDDKYGSIPSLNEVGINTYVQLASRMDTNITLDTIIQDVKNVGIIFDVQDKANSLADSMQKSLDNIKAKVPTSEARKKVIVIVNYGAASFSVYGANASLQTEMLNILNADNVIEKGGSASLENIISTNPDHIIYVTATKNASTDADAVSKILAEPTLQNVTAIKNKSIISVDYTEFMGYGYRTFDCLEKLSSVFYPEIFNKS
ncbi:ABC transporter substrate-binding protein [Clostridium beijerinckii]|uniref:ABC transporter substrate-binding protein n=1 Tax=Clostridium beijerinckii TaxID=1520 RepID=UPI00098BE0F1|nr:ABC transporter substrate-binding protein [Clostridium beijerinckii]MBA8932783.1 iron complex transport system substrate-binding protein [Clostridium beijerinckii]NRT37259.1 iron complex transport system substrate-binding protein [Clostridium beijerinckii]NRT43307.1 iron complex transport system substrate-binding protein [Clostridium beijerinckii]NRU36986.1 iron complex transport system substrate-binding protein [Clostridium beijerinckii]NRZ22703.1 iron complex transport system substrate-bi